MKKVLATGCFDCLHPGHVELLQFASSLGDALIVGINDDQSIRRLKGPERPIYDEDSRLFMICSLRVVDEAFIFTGDDVSHVIWMIKPDIWVKGSDRSIDTIHPAEKEAADRVGCKIVFCPLKPGFSTTALVNRLKRPQHEDKRIPLAANSCAPVQPGRH